MKEDYTRFCPACGTEMFFPDRFARNTNEASINTNSKHLLYIKIAHTAIWLVFVAAILYVLYAGIFDKVNALVWICIAKGFLT